MILDDIDLKILWCFLKIKKGEKLTSWGVMKKVYPEGKDLEHMRIIHKIKRMAKDNLFFISGDPKRYILIKDNVKLNKIPKMKNFISLKINNSWEIFEV